MRIRPPTPVPLHRLEVDVVVRGELADERGDVGRRVRDLGGRGGSGGLVRARLGLLLRRLLGLRLLGRCAFLGRRLVLGGVLVGCALARRLLLSLRRGLLGLVRRGGPAAGTVALDGATDDGEVGADGDGLVLLDEDLAQRPGHGGGDLGVDLVGRDLEKRLVDLDGVADALEPPGDGALGDRLAEGRHADGRPVAGSGRGRGRLGRLGLGRRLRRRGGLRLGLLLLGRLAGIRLGVRLGGRLRSGTTRRGLTLPRGATTGAARRLTIADDREVGADGDGVVLLDEDLLKGARDGGWDLGVDLVGRDLEKRLVDLDAVTHVLEPPGHSALGHGLAQRGHGHAFRHGLRSPSRGSRRPIVVAGRRPTIRGGPCLHLVIVLPTDARSDRTPDRERPSATP